MSPYHLCRKSRPNPGSIEIDGQLIAIGRTGIRSMQLSGTIFFFYVAEY